MAFRSNYWSCGKFAHWVRKLFGLPVIASGTGKEWVEFRKLSNAKNKLVHWITEEFFCMVQDFVMYPFDTFCAILYYVFNRWVSQTHMLKTSLKPGAYYDLDTRILDGLFTELVNFVEVEKAWHHCMCDKVARAKYNPPWWHRFHTWRCADAGVELLDWECQLVMDETYNMSPGDTGYGEPTPQANTAIIQRMLYHWWKNIRPNRKDPYDVSGWSAICDSKRGDDFLDLLNDDNEATSVSLKTLREIETAYDEEDTKMLIELINIRKSLWT